ncbi:hypothetical protein, partial [Segatella copri]
DPEEKHNLAKKYPKMVIGFDKVMTNYFKIMGSIFFVYVLCMAVKGFWQSHYPHRQEKASYQLG